MSINFPTSLDSLTNPISTDSMSAVPHATQHADANDAIEALEAKVGINGSAVTTSHDYKLSGVTGSDKAVSKTGTETLTNKTLTAPQINMGSDATGDMYYRTAGGVTARLPIGTTLQVLNVDASGIPAWVANPSATQATTTAAGIVELATTAETETGTDATRAVTPDGLHDMTTLAGAAWFLDEDTMSSDSATKTASQQSIKAYVDGLDPLPYVPNTKPTHNSWFTFEVPLLADDNDATNNFQGWVNTAVGDGVNSAGGLAKILSNGGNTNIATALPGVTAGYDPSESKDIRIKVRMAFSTTSNLKGWGIMNNGAFAFVAQTDGTPRSVRFVENAGTLYAVTSNNASATATDVSSGITRTNMNTYEIVFNPGTDAKFYINGTLVATHTTNLPTTGAGTLAVGLDTTAQYIYSSPFIVSVEI